VSTWALRGTATTVTTVQFAKRGSIGQSPSLAADIRIQIARPVLIQTYHSQLINVQQGTLSRRNSLLQQRDLLVHTREHTRSGGGRPTLTKQLTTQLSLCHLRCVITYAREYGYIGHSARISNIETTEMHNGRISTNRKESSASSWIFRKNNHVYLDLGSKPACPLHDLLLPGHVFGSQMLVRQHNLGSQLYMYPQDGQNRVSTHHFAVLCALLSEQGAEREE